MWARESLRTGRSLCARLSCGTRGTRLALGAYGALCALGPLGADLSLLA